MTILDTTSKAKHDFNKKKRADHKFYNQFECMESTSPNCVAGRHLLTAKLYANYILSQ